MGQEIAVTWQPLFLGPWAGVFKQVSAGETEHLHSQPSLVQRRPDEFGEDVRPVGGHRHPSDPGVEDPSNPGDAALHSGSALMAGQQMEAAYHRAPKRLNIPETPHLDDV